MKLKHISLLALPLLAMAVASCDDDFDYPPTIIPKATMTPNYTITELKARYWDKPEDGVYTDSYQNTWYAPIGLTPEGDSIRIAGTIISSDRAGNVYKNLMVRGEGPDGEAVTFAIDKGTGDSILSRAHKYGQRIVINVTGMYIGKYRNYMEIGDASTSYGITYLNRQVFDAASQVDGMPHLPVEPVTTTIGELQAAKNTPEGLQKWQSQLVKLEGVTFVDGGKATFGDKGDWGDRYIVDTQGNRINVRCSGKSDFAWTTIPTGTGTLVGLCGFFGTDWQISLNGINRTVDLIGFDWSATDDPVAPDDPDRPVDPGMGDGTAENPYTLAALASATNTTNVWVTGYIVGNVDGEGKSIASESKFEAPFTIATNLLLAAEPGVTDYAACTPVQLPAGAVRTALNLVDNPGNLGKQVTILCNIEKYFGVSTGLKGATAFAWGDKGGETPSEPEVPDGNITFVKATTIESGKQYIFVTPAGQVAYPIEANKTYGYLYAKDPISTSGDEITTEVANAITITANGDGYTLVDCYGRYISVDDTHFSFQLYTEVNPGSIWGITLSGSDATIVNRHRDTLSVRWSETEKYQDFTVTDDTSLPVPVLYVAK